MERYDVRQCLIGNNVQATSQTYFKTLFQYLPKEVKDNAKILRHDRRYKALNETWDLQNERWPL